MLTIPASLTAHQKLKARLPAIAVTASTRRGNVDVLRWARYYTGAESETNSPHAAAIAGDGSLLRARNDAGTLQVSRVASPGPGSTYSSWTSLGAVAPSSGVALAGSTGEQTLVNVRSGGLNLDVRHSADNGATWGAATARATEASAITWCAVVYMPNGDLIVLYAVGATVKRVRRAASAWGATAAWSQTMTSVTGLAATYLSNDVHYLVSGVNAADTARVVNAGNLGDGNLPVDSWSSLRTVTDVDINATPTLHEPAIVAVGTGFQAAYALRETGNVPFNRCFTTYPPDGSGILQDWREPSPHGATAQDGLALTLSSTTAWATTPAGVWAAPATPSPSTTMTARCSAARPPPTAASSSAASSTSRSATAPAQPEPPSTASSSC